MKESESPPNIESPYLRLLAGLAKGLGQVDDFDKLLKVAVTEAQTGFSFRHVSLFLLEGAFLRLVAYAGPGESPFPEAFHHPALDGVLGQVVSSGQTYLANDVTTDPFFEPGIEGALSELALPVFVEEELMGVLDIESARREAFSPKDVDVLEVFASQLGVALRYADALAISRKRAREMETILKVSRRTLESLNTSEVLAHVAKAIHEELGYHHVLIFLYRLDGELTLRARAGETPRHLPLGFVLPKGDSLTIVAASEGEPILVGDVSKEKRFLEAIPGTESALALPIKGDEETLGVITVESQRKDDFHPFDVRVLRVLSEEIAKAIRNARLYDAMRRARDKMARLAEFSKRISSSLSMEAILDVVVTDLPSLASLKGLSIFLLNEDKSQLRLWAHNRDDWSLSSSLAVPREPSSLLWSAIQCKEPRFVNDMESELGREKKENFRTGAFGILPLISHGEPIGVLNVDDPDIGLFSTDLMALLEGLSSQLGTALSNALKYESTVRLSLTDSLTGLWLRRFFDPALHREWARARRIGNPLSVVMVDLDHFKTVNDSYGHDVGDCVLKETAERIRNAIREIDIACRFGGEEFLLVLPDTGSSEAVHVAERIRSSLESKPFSLHTSPLSITASIGVATWQSTDANRDAVHLVKEADEALYQAKNSGRNCVVSAS
ncbi:sensor domain-containing diguanylate cyclase [bacterium]|nr:sensor domain-containing diguanylate cyclase [bacterium]